MDGFPDLLEGTRFLPRLRTNSIRSSESRQHFRPPAVSPESPPPTGASDQPEIVAPTPRRHLLENSESQRWLRTPPHSPTSSRGTSPVVRNFNLPSPSFPKRHDLDRHLSFSSLTEPFPVKAGWFSQRATDRDGTEEASMAKRWIRWMHTQGMKGWVVPAAIVVSTWIKWCISLGSYSGQPLACVVSSL
jgi:alpha-1,3-glucosyltransferase